MDVRIMKASELIQMEEDRDISDKRDYSVFSEEQFMQYAKLYIKDEICNEAGFEFDSNGWQKLNNFFENIPEYLLFFSTEEHRLLLMKYIMSNLATGFQISFAPGYPQENLYRIILNLKDKDPRLK